MEIPSYLRMTALSILAASLLGCTEGKRKDSEASVYDHGITRCKTLAASLKDFDVDLSGHSTTMNDDDARLSEDSKKKTRLTQIQPLLEDYILTADRLLKLGDTTVVVFPERQTLVASRVRAAKYLGQVYAERSWAQKEFGIASSPDVDRAETNARMERLFKSVAALAKLGFDPQSKNPALDYATATKKMTAAQLRALYIQVALNGNDALRMIELLERNENWQDKVLAAIKTASQGSLIYMEQIRAAAHAELELRHETAPNV